MKLSALLAPLIAAKADHATIMDVVLAFEAQQTDALERRRANDRERQERRRHVKSRDVTVTVSSRARVEDSSSKEDISGKENKKEAAPTARQPRGSRIPDDFQPDIGAAIAEGVSRQDAEREAQSFVDYWRARAGREAVKLDWPATWRVWYRRNLGRKSSTAPPKRDTYVDAMNRILEGRANGTENLFGTDGDAQRLPADGKRQGIDVADVRGGLARRFIQGSH